MSKNEKNNSVSKLYSKLFGSTFGHIAFASFFIAVITGVLLAIPYNVEKAYDSVSLIILTNPGAEFIRSLHYWSAQFFLIFIFLHIWDHLRKATERKVKKGVWLRLIISLLAVFFVMLSGFILKGDADSLQAKRIITTLLNEIPLIGKYISYSLLGKGSQLQLVYINHVAAATIFLWLVIIEHVKSVWPELKTTIYFIAPMIVLSFFFPSGLHNNLNPVMKGPWYFVGLQELFHYFSAPIIVLVFLVLLLILLYLLPKIDVKSSRLIKWFIFGFSLVYIVLTIIGFFFRGENWKFEMPWNNTYFSFTDYNPIIKSKNYFVSYNNKKEIPIVLKQRESCLYCHSDMKGFSPSHSPEAVGCTSCHLGNPFSLNKSAAHYGMIKIPGNLEQAKLTCGNPSCHPTLPSKVNNTIMTTMSGIISVDRFTFGQSDSLNQIHRIENIRYSAADTHLRNLCASCHIGKVKTKYGPITQLSRGGGCNACHLNYDKKSEKQLMQIANFNSNKIDSVKIKFHPELSLNITDLHCFGCHSRSGRISTNYEGWYETQLSKNSVKKDSTYRILEDGRVFKYLQDDIHHQKGLECIDCHNSYETMGNGTLYAHEEEQTIIQCKDCHFNGEPKTISYDKFDSETQKIARLRKFDKRKRRYLVTAKDGIPLVNTYVENNGKAFLIGKNTKKEFPLKPPDFICTEGSAHKNLTCNSCHTSWAPQCVTCHTDYDPSKIGIDHLTGRKTNGKWVESAGGFFAGPPTLGVVVKQNEKRKEEVIDTFIPGMILTIDKSKFSSSKDSVIFKRLFAPTVPHTTMKQGRSCKSCHNNPLAIGYGRGKLIYQIKGKWGHWEFKPEFVNIKYDGLPQDAWIGFLDSTKQGRSTRTDARSFNINEQRKILTVGACLTCHAANSKVMKNSLIDFNSLLKKISVKCVLPDWLKKNR